jgi:hypothetical protein
MFLAGCVSFPDGPEYAVSKAQAGKPGYAILYVFRENAAPTAFDTTIRIDDKDVGALAQGGFTWIYAKPGLRRVTAVWSTSSSQTPAALDVQLVEGQTYYLAVSGQSKVNFLGGPGMSIIPTSFDMGSALVEVPAASAEEALTRCCKLHKPLQPEF